jgi:hypothetical protein
MICLCRLAITCLILVISPAKWAHADTQVVDWEVVGNRLVTLGSDGMASVYSIETAALDTSLSKILSTRNLVRLASDGESLWAADKKDVWAWDATSNTWEHYKSLPKRDEGLIGLLSLDDGLVAIYPHYVDLLFSSKAIKVPYLEGQVRTNNLNVLTHYTDGAQIWFGTGYGEWGGHLIRLNLKTEKWNSYYDALHYVTGITQSSEGELTVTWAMSHFMADTLVRTHDLNTEVKKQFPNQENKYLQAIVYEPSERSLFAVEQNVLVKLENGIPEELQELGELRYSPEPKAIGVSPGVLAMAALQNGTILIIHKWTAPFLYKNGQLIQFDESKHKNN